MGHKVPEMNNNKDDIKYSFVSEKHSKNLESFEMLKTLQVIFDLTQKKTQLLDNRMKLNNVNKIHLYSFIVHVFIFIDNFVQFKNM